MYKTEKRVASTKQTGIANIIMHAKFSSKIECVFFCGFGHFSLCFQQNNKINQ